MDIEHILNKFNDIKHLSKICDDELTHLSKKINKIETNNLFKDTYLENKESIIELYKLFFFYGFIEYVFNHIEYNNNNL